MEEKTALHSKKQYKILETKMQITNTKTELISKRQNEILEKLNNEKPEQVCTMGHHRLDDNIQHHFMSNNFDGQIQSSNQQCSTLPRSSSFCKTEKNILENQNEKLK